MEAEPSHLAGSMSLAPNTSVTDCNWSAEGAGWGLVIWACVEDCRRNSSPAAPATQSVSRKDRFIESGPWRITIQDRPGNIKVDRQVRESLMKYPETATSGAIHWRLLS